VIDICSAHHCLAPQLATTRCDGLVHWRRLLWDTETRAPLDFQLFNFSGHFRAAQTLTLDSMWLPTQKEYTPTGL